MDTRENKSTTRRRTTATGASSSSRRSSQRTMGTARTSTATPSRTASRPASRSTSKAGSRSTASAATRRTVTTTRRKRSAAPDVVYTPAAPISRGKLLLRLLTVVAVVMALVFGISIFFHVETITVSGAQKYEAWTVREASGLKEGDSLLGVNDAQVSGNIITKLPYVKSVRVGIKLPNTVNIYIEEQDALYAIRDASKAWWLVTSEGLVVENVMSDRAGEVPQILGIALYKPVPAQPGVAEEPEPQTPAGTTGEGETTPPPVTILGEQRLNTALDIIQYLEANKLVDKIVSVDVTDMGNILVTYGQQYEINLGDTTELKYKLELVTKAIPKLNQQYSDPVGIIDASLKLDKQLIFTFGNLSGK